MSEFIPSQPLPPVNKPALILSGFGLPLLKPKFYKTGESISQGGTEIKPEISGYIGSLGLPVFGGISFLDLPSGNNLYLDCCLIEVAQQRNIVTTSLNGFDGTVKQFISNGDYAVTIRGVLSASKKGYYPDFEMKLLQEVATMDKEIKISCQYLQDFFKIKYLVVQYARFPQLEGNMEVQPFELQCLSDLPLIFVKNA